MRTRATAAATLVTAVVLVGASVVIVQLVERDLESNARSALSSALENASHAANGEGGGLESGESHDGGESGAGEGGEVSGEGQGDARQQAITDASIQEVQAGVDAASNALLIIVPIVVLALTVAIWWTVGRALRPVRDISAQVSEISGSTLDERVPVPRSGDEIAELAVLMNEMLDRLETSAVRQRAFVADASHELRSPLATLVAGIEVASVSPDPAKLQKLTTKLSGEATRMQTLVADLLDLARLDEDRHQPLSASVDITALARDVIARFGSRDDIDVELSAPASVEVSGSKTQIDRMLFNLIDNAVTYADAQVVVAIEHARGTAKITVDDDGPGIPHPDRERVFERFVRLDDSRGRGTGGSGIGLAMVSGIVDRHGGSVTVADSQLGGARLAVVIPTVGSLTPG